VTWHPSSPAGCWRSRWRRHFACWLVCVRACAQRTRSTRCRRN
jgi:hypothetical protein